MIVRPFFGLHTVICQRPTPPTADIMYMMMMAICTSVTSTLGEEIRVTLHGHAEMLKLLENAF